MQIIIVAGILSFCGFTICLLVRIARRDFVRSLLSSTNGKVAAGFASVFVLLVIGYLFMNLQSINADRWVELSLLAGLVGITAVYAFFTAMQVGVSAKTIDEMTRQRYDAVRPVIDIVVKQRALEVYAASLGDPSHGLPCILCNVGIGPAIDVCFFFQHPERGRLLWKLDPLASGEKTDEKNLSLKHPENRMALVTYYRDVYDRCFKSSREISIEKDPNPSWVIGTLKIERIDQKELPK